MPIPFKYVYFHLISFFLSYCTFTALDDDRLQNPKFWNINLPNIEPSEYRIFGISDLWNIEPS